MPKSNQNLGTSNNGGNKNSAQNNQNEPSAKNANYIKNTTLDTSTMSSYTIKSQMVASFNANLRMNPQTIISIKRDGEILVTKKDDFWLIFW